MQNTEQTVVTLCKILFCSWKFALYNDFGLPVSDLISMEINRT